MCRLFQEVFGDDRELVLNYLAKYDTPATRVVRYDNDGNLIAAMHYHVFDAKNYRGAYIYGVATLKQWRGRGLARQMLEESFQRMRDEGVQMAMLIAEQVSLRKWYSTMGFELLERITVDIIGYDGMSFVLDDKTMNVPMVKIINDANAMRDIISQYNVAMDRKIFIPSPKTV